jgi:hypothetical protein
MHGMKNGVRFLLLLGLAVQASAATMTKTASTCDSGQQIRRVVQEALAARGISENDVLPFDEELCSRAAQVQEGDPIELLKVRWDEVLRSIEVRLRCKSAAGCLPFLLRVRMRAGQRYPTLSRDKSANAPAATPEGQIERGGARALHVPKIVRPGQIVTLIWEQGDMHIARRVICLDPGGENQEVRTRSKEGGRIVRARVMAAGLVKAL